MSDLIKWWIFFEIIGWIVFPICFNLFKNQFDKGFTFSKIIALLIWGYIFWIGNTFAIIRNTQAGAISAFVVVALVSIIYFLDKSKFSEIKAWVILNKKIIVFSELLFVFSILLMTLLRGVNPWILGTEKPMELTFINGILRSETFPPNDPWLSEYSISYYYFGYLIISAIIRIIGTDAGIAFNLALIFWFALISYGSFGILLNLLVEKSNRKKENSSKLKLNKILLFSLMAPLLILIISNGEGLLELIHSRGIFWETGTSGEIVSKFWGWLDVKELTEPPPLPYDWLLNRSEGTWWWRASRVLQDYTMLGNSREIIDEFPFFSFFLGDLHPHVLAMPFVLLCIFSGFAFLTNTMETKSKLIENGLSFWKNGFNWFFAFSLGSLIFLNTWDFPIYFFLAAIIVFIKMFQTNEDIRKVVLKVLAVLFSFGIICILFYLPFLLSFASQAGGILPSLIYQSRSIHLFIMFMPFIAINGIFLVFCFGTKLPLGRIFKNWVFILFAFMLLLGFSFLTPTVLGFIPKFFTYLQEFSIRDYDTQILQSSQRLQSFLSIYDAGDLSQLIATTISRILADPIDLLILLTLLSIIISVCVTYLSEKGYDHKKMEVTKSDLFVLILEFLGLGLILFPELFYLRDQFGWRMNTIFKFYYQAWILLAICTAYALTCLSEIKQKISKIVINIICIISLFSGFVYPYFAIKERISLLNDQGIVLNGNNYLLTSNSNELDAIKYLNSIQFGIISEAVGGSYSNFGRVSKLTGLPTVLGWPGHESQWRGGAEEIGSREVDIKDLYSTDNWDLAEGILKKYNIRYIFVGDLERTTYKLFEPKFKGNLSIIFSNESVNIYEYHLGKE
jgi:YYY domain-containing protein